MPKKQRRSDGDMDPAEFRRELEELIDQLSQRIYRAALIGDSLKLEIDTRIWTQAQGLWLQNVQGLSVDQAREVIVAFATRGAFTAWSDGPQDGPPPTVLTLYKKDRNEHGKQQEENNQEQQ